MIQPIEYLGPLDEFEDPPTIKKHKVKDFTMYIGGTNATKSHSYKKVKSQYRQTILLWAYAKCKFPDTACMLAGLDGWENNKHMMEMDLPPGDIFRKLRADVHKEIERMDLAVYSLPPKMPDMRAAQMVVPEGWLLELRAGMTLKGKFSGFFTYTARNKGYFGGKVRITSVTLYGILECIGTAQYWLDYQTDKMSLKEEWLW